MELKLVMQREIQRVESNGKNNKKLVRDITVDSHANKILFQNTVRPTTTTTMPTATRGFRK